MPRREKWKKIHSPFLLFISIFKLKKLLFVEWKMLNIATYYPRYTRYNLCIVLNQQKNFFPPVRSICVNLHFLVVFLPRSLYKKWVAATKVILLPSVSRAIEISQNLCVFSTFFLLILPDEKKMNKKNK
jgi:hypothetical protein